MSDDLIFEWEELRVEDYGNGEVMFTVDDDEQYSNYEWLKRDQVVELVAGLQRWLSEPLLSRVSQPD